MSSDESESDKCEVVGSDNNVLPEKSKEKYMKAYDHFLVWKTEKGIGSEISESVLLLYFKELSSTKKASSLWCIFSMLRTTISINHNVQIKTFTKLTAFLKRKYKGYHAKKSKVLTAQNVETFLNEAPDNTFLAIKVALIFGVYGACRAHELSNLKIQDIERQSKDLLLINLSDTQTKKKRSFMVSGKYAQIIKKYQNLRPTDMNTDKFFIAYRNGKCTRQCIGKNKIILMPQEIARFLNLEEAELYTGRCFRRTSATLLADSGATLTDIKRHGGWQLAKFSEEATMVLKLYGVSDGPPSLSVRQALTHLKVPFELINVDFGAGDHMKPEYALVIYFKVPFELINVDFGAGDHMKPEYALMNPQKEIPVLDDDGFFLSESNAILQYVCDKFKPDSPLYPKEPKARALVNHRLCFNLSTYYANISAYTMAPIFFDYERTPLGLKKVHIALNVFETYLDRLGSSHAAADHLTIADFQLINSTMTLEAIDFDFSKYKKIHTWYNTFKKDYPELWKISEGAMKEIQHFAANPPDLTHMDHPIHPIRKINK